nr:hypothetical protein Itr_chr13CG13130 [Ipomoea trifida]
MRLRTYATIDNHANQAYGIRDVNNMAQQYIVGTIYEYLTCVPVDVIKCAPLDDPIQNARVDLLRQREYRSGQLGHDGKRMQAINTTRKVEATQHGNEEADTEDDENDLENPPLYS